MVHKIQKELLGPSLELPPGRGVAVVFVVGRTATRPALHANDGRNV